jgi:hypothetical protein
MDDLFARERAWWSALTPSQRRDVKQVTDALPAWLVQSLVDARIPVIEADLADHSPVFLMPTHVRSFLEQESRAMRMYAVRLDIELPTPPTDAIITSLAAEFGTVRQWPETNMISITDHVEAQMLHDAIGKFTEVVRPMLPHGSAILDVHADVVG